MDIGLELELELLMLWAALLAHILISLFNDH